MRTKRPRLAQGATSADSDRPVRPAATALPRNGRRRRGAERADLQRRAVHHATGTDDPKLPSSWPSMPSPTASWRWAWTGWPATWTRRPSPWCSSTTSRWACASWARSTKGCWSSSCGSRTRSWPSSEEEGRGDHPLRQAEEAGRSKTGRVERRLVPRASLPGERQARAQGHRQLLHARPHRQVHRRAHRRAGAGAKFEALRAAAARGAEGCTSELSSGRQAVRSRHGRRRPGEVLAQPSDAATWSTTASTCACSTRRWAAATSWSRPWTSSPTGCSTS